jgi:hypothetical protein
MNKENIIQYIDQDNQYSQYKDNTPLDTIKMEGFVEIQNGDTHIKAKNKFVQTTLQHITNMIAGYGWWNSVTTFYGPIRSYSIYIGQDISTPTAYNSTALSSPIGTSPGTGPNSISGTVSSPSNGIFNMSITATWNPGTLSGIVGEMALYMNIYTAGNLRAFQWGGGYNPPSAVMASRLSVADGDFSSFAINTLNPLSIAWTIQLRFT